MCTRHPVSRTLGSKDHLHGAALDTTLPLGISHPHAPAIRGLFQKHVTGDDAILRLAQLRFAESGMAAELYADTPQQLERELQFLPHHPALPVVHLNRNVNLLHEDGRSLVEAFIRQFSGRLLGLVIHDRPEMAVQIQEVVSAMKKVAGELPGSPAVFLEYAAGMDPERFVELAQRLAGICNAGICIDIGHIGIRESRRRLADISPGLDFDILCREADRAPELISDVRDATRSSLQIVLDMIQAVGAIGNPLHFHLHDGHPLIPGLADHFSFLPPLPIPSIWEGHLSLEPMYGLSGLSKVLATIAANCAPDRCSITLEVHQSEGRLPLGDAEKLFAHWEDLTNAERMNYWLSVLADNYVIATTILGSIYRQPQVDLV